MEIIRAILNDNPYPHEHSRYAIIAVFVGCIFFISSDFMHIVLEKCSVKWWSMSAYLLGSFYLFYSPFIGKTIKPNYSNFSRWYIAWILVAALYHLPNFQSLGLDLRMNLSLFLTIYMSSICFLVFFHIVFLVLRFIGLVSDKAREFPEILIILQNCAVISMACCVFYSRCGNQAIPRQKSLVRQHSSWFSFWKRENKDNTTWLAKFIRMIELRDQMCSSWFAPVGSASDYPLLSKWFFYGKIACNGSCPDSSDEFSPINSLWVTLIGLYIANYVVERSTGWALTHPMSVDKYEELKNEQTKPKFLDMVPWYSGTSADLFKTMFDLLVSVTVFVGRFDMRMLQAALTKSCDGSNNDFFYDHLADKEEFWFDFMADTGDGGNSTYTVAKLLAQPSINVLVGNKFQSLPRGKVLLIGGDLAYPNPSDSTYENRLFYPFEEALEPPHCYKKDSIAVQKPELPEEVSDLKDYDGPQCFLIPGNHDWFDGLNTFMRYICHKSWLGGWFMPQKKSYFSLQLPKGWWVFGLDLALHGDIDVNQFRFFSQLVKEKVGDNDAVIIITHEPNWLFDWYWSKDTGKNVGHLICDVLKYRCKLRMAGDLHHYMRHSCTKSDGPAHVQHLLVNGCGGAFLHPTHVFSSFSKFYRASYGSKVAYLSFDDSNNVNFSFGSKVAYPSFDDSNNVNFSFGSKVAYPSFDDSRKIALGNILKFRKKNWRFDFIGGIIYFILVFSLFPQCKLAHILRRDSFSGHLESFLGTVWSAFAYVMEQSYVSFTGVLVFLITAITFVPSKISWKGRVLIGVLHVAAHLISALILMLMLELGIEICIQHNILANSGYHSLYQWYKSVENEHFPDLTGLRARIEQWTFGFYPACIKYLMSAFDVPEVMAVTRSNICKEGMESLSRGKAILYYASVFLYFWVFSTPVVSLVFGSYLYICINWLHIHFDEALSSLRIANNKSFTRFYIQDNGDIEVFTLAVDKVPKEWKMDKDWNSEAVPSQGMSYKRKFPSKWCASTSKQDPIKTVKIVDHFVIHKSAEENR